MREKISHPFCSFAGTVNGRKKMLSQNKIADKRTIIFHSFSFLFDFADNIFSSFEKKEKKTLIGHLRYILR